MTLHIPLAVPCPKAKVNVNEVGVTYNPPEFVGKQNDNRASLLQLMKNDLMDPNCLVTESTYDFREVICSLCGPDF